MNVKIERQRIIKPLYENHSLPSYIPLTVFDKINYDMQVAFIFAYHPPAPSTETIELGLRKTLSVFRTLAGRLGKDAKGESIILLNDEGIKFVEASIDTTLDQVMPLEPSPWLLNLHPDIEDVVELVQIQLTRFKCGSLVVGFTEHHLVADGPSICLFMVALGHACRGLGINPLPVWDQTMFVPRDPPCFEFEHRGFEFMSKNQPIDCSKHNDIVVTKAHFSLDFLNKLKIESSSSSDSSLICPDKPYTTFECLVAHLWRTMAKARELNEHEITYVRISVDGRMRMNPRVPYYFGNLVLWAFPTSNVKDLVNKPLPYAAKLIRDAVTKVNDNYFRSFIDFANYKAKGEDLIPTADMEPFSCPNIDVDSWLNFPFSAADFGTGTPFLGMPSYLPIEGQIYLLPSMLEHGSIDAFVGVFKHHLDNFQQMCYSCL